MMTRVATYPDPLYEESLAGDLNTFVAAYLLAYNVSRKEIAVDAVFQCPNCHKYNEA